MGFHQQQVLRVLRNKRFKNKNKYIMFKYIILLFICLDSAMQLHQVQAPITPSFKVIGYFGGTTSEAQVTASLGNVTATAKAKQANATFGTALAYSVSDNVAFTTEWIRYSPEVSSTALVLTEPCSPFSKLPNISPKA